MTDAPGQNAYPIAATTFILMHKQPKDKAKSKAALDFFKCALEKGQAQARKLDYVPLPAELVKQIESYIGSTSSERDARPSATKQRRRPQERGRRPIALFQLITAGAAWFVLLLLGGVALSMAWGGRLRSRPSAGTSSRHGLGRRWRQFRRARSHLRHAGHRAIAMIIAVPVSFGIALFLTDVAPRWMRGPIAAAIELLAGIPSIIYGMWGLFVFVPFMAAHVEPWLNDHLGNMPLIGALFSGPPIGIGMLTAGIVLAIMVIPFISRSCATCSSRCRRR